MEQMSPLACLFPKESGLIPREERGGGGGSIFNVLEENQCIGTACDPITEDGGRRIICSRSRSAT